MKHKVIINLPDCKKIEYQTQQEECYNTWIPLLEKRNIKIIKSVSNQTLNKEYELIDNVLYCNCEDTLDHNFILKRFYFIKWALENENFDYLFLTSFDTFVHPDRFLKIVDEYIQFGGIDAAGCIHPYQGWNPYENFQLFINIDYNDNPNFLISGGPGYLLSVNACKIIVKNFSRDLNPENKPWDDYLFSTILRKNGIKLFHDNRIMLSSPNNIIWDDSQNIGVPRIDSNDGNFLAVQHSLDGQMYDIMNNLKLEKTKFGIYTTFYNCERFIDRIFSNIESLNYNNFEWHITDDYSTDNTRQMVLDRLDKSPIKDKIKFIDQSEKKEMYWKPNIFFDKSFEWIVLVDADDLVDPDFLSVYDFYTQKYDNISLISCEFHKINEDNNSLHSITYLINDDKITNKLDRYHPSIDYLNNTSYSCFGHLRAFKHSSIDEFKVDDMLACAEDSYHVFWSNSYGKYLHIPRPLYTWTLRDDSESHTKEVPANFNGNFNISLNKLKSSDCGVVMDFNEVYVETCTLSSYDIGGLKNKKVSLWTRSLSKNQKQKLKELYPETDLCFNELDSEVHLVSLNYIRKKELEYLVKNAQTKKFLFYYQNNNYHMDSKDMDQETHNKLVEYTDILKNHIGFSWWVYIRHFIIKSG